MSRAQEAAAEIVRYKIAFPLNKNDASEVTAIIERTMLPVGSFEWALVQMKEGKKVRRKGWHPNVLLTIKEGQRRGVDWMGTPYAVNRDTEVIRFIFSVADIMATDWECIE